MLIFFINFHGPNAESFLDSLLDEISNVEHRWTDYQRSFQRKITSAVLARVCDVQR